MATPVVPLKRQNGHANVKAVVEKPSRTIPWRKLLVIAHHDAMSSSPDARQCMSTR